MIFSHSEFTLFHSRSIVLILQGKKLPKVLDDTMALWGGGGDVSDEDEAADVPDDSVKQNLKKSSEAHTKLSKDLSDTVVFCQSVHFKGFAHAQNNCE